MRLSPHVIKRGKRFHFVQRIPADLRPLFPKPTIWKSLKTDDAKDAQLLGNAEEYKTQRLFLQLRSTMLPKELEKRLIALHLKRGVDTLEAQATGQTKGIDKEIERDLHALGETMEYSTGRNQGEVRRIQRAHGRRHEEHDRRQ